MDKDKLSYAPLLALPAIPLLVVLPSLELRLLTATALGIGGLKMWQEMKRHRNNSAIIRASVDAADHSVIAINTEGMILSVNKHFTDKTGYTANDVIGSSYTCFIAPRHGKSADPFNVVSANEIFWEGEIWCRRLNGEEFPEWWSLKAIEDCHGKTYGYLITGVDMFQEKRHRSEKWHNDNTDRLTGLANRERVFDLLDFYIPKLRITRQDEDLDLCVIDIDGFHWINSSLGAEAGDCILKSLAERFLADESIVFAARIGSDEFFIAKHSRASCDHSKWVKQVHELATTPLYLRSNSITEDFTLSVTMGTLRLRDILDDSTNGDSLIQCLEASLYRAKVTGSNTIKRFDPFFDTRDESGIFIVQRLRNALRDKFSLSLHYQKQFSLTTGHVEGMEALIRWNDQEKGSISPADFIPLAEQHGLIIQLGAWVIEHSIRQVAAWKAAGFSVPCVWINISAAQLFHEDLERTLSTYLALYDVEASAIGLEITESLMLDDRANNLFERLTSLQNRGHMVAIDDFGTGHSSLSYLAALPVDKIKIDRAFVRSIDRSLTNQAIVKSIMTIAESVGASVVAEGVETPQQVAILEALGCDCVQGYLFAHPEPSDVLSLAV